MSDLANFYVGGRSQVYRTAAAVPAGGGGGGGGAFVGARVDSLNQSPPDLANNVRYWMPLTDLTVAIDTSSFVTTAPGTGLAPAGTVCFVVPAGMDGTYDISAAFALQGLSTPFGWYVAIDSDISNASGSYIQQLRPWVGNVGSLALRSGGSSDDSIFEGAATVTAQAVPLVAGDTIVFSAFQRSGGNINFDYAAFSLTKSGGSVGASSSIYGGIKTIANDTTKHMIADSLVTGGGTSWDNLSIVKTTAPNPHFEIVEAGVYETRLLVGALVPTSSGFPWYWRSLLGLGSSSSGGGEAMAWGGGLPDSGVLGFSFQVDMALTSIDAYAVGDIPDATIIAGLLPVSATTFTVSFQWTMTRLS